MVKCKYYNDGICFSEITIKTFGEPSREPVNPAFCLTERYRECRYYPGNSGDREDLYKAIGIDVSKDYYLPVHAIPCSNISGCPFYKLYRVSEEEEVCVAYCEAFEKYIVRSAVKRCIEFWRECPIYKTVQELAG